MPESKFTELPLWHRDHPYPARLSAQYRLTSAHSDKDVRHIEIDLGDSGLRYEPGDTLGIWVHNDPTLIMEILDVCGLTGDELIVLNDVSWSLREALTSKFEVTQVHPGFIKRFAEKNPQPALQSIATTPALLRQYLEHRQIIEVLLEFPCKLEAAALIECLRQLLPRQYSIASSPLVSPAQVALTVAKVQFNSPNGPRQGAGSGFLCERVDQNTVLPVYLVSNPNFKLPTDPGKPLIMIGPGTGIAPFRAFLQHQQQTGATGSTWLLFGNPHRATDYLYEAELEAFKSSGVLSQLTLAFSRDQAAKCYVQHRMLEQAPALFKALEAGAYVYVCGDAKRMADDVQKALLQIIETCGGLAPPQARQYLVKMRQEGRYQRDVY